MKLLFISNFLNHHQEPICKAFYSHLLDDFKFIGCEKVPGDKIDLGYKKSFDYPFFIECPSKKEIYSYLKDFDVLIAGSCPFEYIDYFINNKKLVYVYSERLFKDGTWHKYSPLARYNMNKLYNKKYNPRMYLLCSSAYTSSDYLDFNSFKNQALKWGYFPDTSQYSYIDLSKKKKKNSLIWVGRLIGWKHPEQAINVAKFLKQNNINFSLTIIGDGPLKTKLESLIKKYDLTSFVTLTGPLNFKRVRELMEESEILLFTSDFNEGWGAVLNEAMASATIPLASYKAGSSLYLLEDMKDLIYSSKQDDLDKKCLALLKDTNRADLAKKVFDIINTTWNHEVAAKRLIEVSNNILNDTPLDLPSKGPISRAQIISNKIAKKISE